MKFEITSEWLLKNAEKEGDGILSVGGLVNRMEEASRILTIPATECAALAQLVEFQRRKLHLSVEHLATKAAIEIEDLLNIEHGHGCDDPRTIFNLADALRLPSEKLMLLAGLVSERDPKLERAALKFAARSASIEKLNKEEMEALEEFVKVLAE